MGPSCSIASIGIQRVPESHTGLSFEMAASPALRPPHRSSRSSNDGLHRTDTILDRSARRLTGSRGTKDCVRRAIEAGIPCYLIDSEAAERRQLREADGRLR